MPAHTVVTLQERDARPLLPAQASPLSLGSKQWHERDTVVALSSSVTSSGMEMNQPCSLLSSAEMDRDTQDSWPAASPNTLCSVNYFYTTFQKPLGAAAYPAKLQLWDLFMELSVEGKQGPDTAKGFALLQEAVRVITNYLAAH